MSQEPEHQQAADVDRLVKARRQPDEEILLGAPPRHRLRERRGYATRFPFNNYLTGQISAPHDLPGATRADNRRLESAAGGSSSPGI